MSGDRPRSLADMDFDSMRSGASPVNPAGARLLVLEIDRLRAVNESHERAEDISSGTIKAALTRVDEYAAALERVDDLIKRAYLRCAYCNEVIPFDVKRHEERTALLLAHAAVCERHPLRAVESERDDLMQAVGEIADLAGTSTFGGHYRVDRECVLHLKRVVAGIKASAGIEP